MRCIEETGLTAVYAYHKICFVAVEFVFFWRILMPDRQHCDAVTPVVQVRHGNTGVPAAETHVFQSTRTP